MPKKPKVKKFIITLEMTRGNVRNDDLIEYIREWVNYGRGSTYPDSKLHDFDLKSVKLFKEQEDPKHESAIGGCIAPGTLVASERGWVPIECLLPGDKVVSHTGALNAIKSVGIKRSSSI